MVMRPLSSGRLAVGKPAYLILALLTATAAAAAAGLPPAKRSFGFHIRSHDFQPTFRRSLLRNATMPLHGAVKDYGYFYATLYLGTPAKKFAVIVDTGSTMTYVPCSNCGSGCGPNHQARGDAAFDPDASSTANLVACGSPQCVCGSPRCGCAAQQCTYQRKYAEESESSGFLVQDMLALHDGQAGAPIIFGCETHEKGEIYQQRADGLFGLGNSEASVVNQLVKAGVIDDVFSLCFGMVEGDGVLLLGDAELPGSTALRYTPLVSSLRHPMYYNVKLLSLAVDGQLLPVPQSLFDQGYGTVLDSGTTFTYMPTPVFQEFSKAVESYALAHGLKRVPGPDPHYDDVCFGVAPSHEDLEGLSRVFPSMEVQFDEGASLVLGPLNYLFVHTFNTGKYCLGVFDNGRAGTLLGGITFRNVLVQYDRANKRVGFGPAPCKELGEMQRPPCSAFGVGGAGDMMAAAAAKDGDCFVDVLRQQQQEVFEPEGDVLGQLESQQAQQQAQQQQQQQQQDGRSAGAGAARRPAADLPAGSGAHGGKAGAQQDAAPGGSSASGSARTPPGQQSQGGGQGTRAQQSGGQQASAASQQQGQQGQQGQQDLAASGAIDAPGALSRSSTGGTDAGSSGSSGGGSLPSVALGMAVVAAAVVALVAAVALLQPAARTRIRGVFSSRSYRTLSDQEQDVEDGILAAGATGSAGSSGSGGSGGDTGSADLAVELSGPRSEYPRGITTPTKLQRTVSNSASADDVAAAVAAGLGGTPRAPSPNRSAL